MFLPIAQPQHMAEQNLQPKWSELYLYTFINLSWAPTLAGVRSLKDNLLFALRHPSALRDDSALQVQPQPSPPVHDRDEGPSNTSSHVETQNTGIEQAQSPPLENMTCIIYQGHSQHFLMC